MASSPPWNLLDFTEEQCIENLQHHEIEIHLAVRVADAEKVAFIATLACGLSFEPMIEYLCVDESLRGSGIGSMLINFFEESMFPEAANLYMFVSDINPLAKALYERLGYAEVGRLPDFNLPGQTEYLLRKTRRPKQLAS